MPTVRRTALLVNGRGRRIRRRRAGQNRLAI